MLALHREQAYEADGLRALGGSLAVHLLLLLALIISLDWSQSPPEAVQAELWSSLPAERPSNTATRNSPSPAPEKRAPPEPTDAEIALQKKQKAQQEARKKEELQKQQAAAKKEAQLKAEKDKAQKAKKLEEQRAAELARLGLDPKAKRADAGKDIVTKAGVQSGVEQGARSGAEAKWVDRVRAMIDSRVSYRGKNTSDLKLDIKLLPTGQITDVRVISRSDSPSYDEAVLAALKQIDTLPSPPEGVRVLSIEIRHRNRN
ncbi:MAG: TonB family protein [Betaproteobacteria bacterium]|nr:TonB family protein [Betaproteobacteria bacterium]NBT74662.1 TonB family protein [Betaproteobacteria bacterium]NCA15982.1 TonB family protein [Betaproteobacteria bacterium]